MHPVKAKSNDILKANSIQNDLISSDENENAEKLNSNRRILDTMTLYTTSSVSDYVHEHVDEAMVNGMRLIMEGYDDCDKATQTRET